MVCGPSILQDDSRVQLPDNSSLLANRHETESLAISDALLEKIFTFSTCLQSPRDLAAVRALLSLALYTMFATTGPSVWHVLGTAMRLATSLGLHKMRSSASLVEEEMAKRAFWSLYNLDRLIASTLGRPLGIADEDISVGLPREFNDDWTEVPGGSTMTIPVQVVKLRRLFSRIYRYCEFFHGGLPFWLTK